jgi:GTP pyrophosphokinase
LKERLLDKTTDIDRPCTVTDGLSIVAEELSDKLRKGSGAPYICHLASVVQIIASYGGLRDTKLAGVFHDVIEDLGWPIERVRTLGGDNVARMVTKLTEDKKLSWEERKKRVCDTISSCCQGVGIVLLADKIDNLASMLREIPRKDSTGFREYWKKFNASGDDQLRFYWMLTSAAIRNLRLTTEKEYPELRTDLALEELLELTYRFDDIVNEQI